MWRSVVRLDRTRPQEFSNSRVWNMSNLHMNTLVYENGQPGDKVVARSFSGNERNRLFFRSGNNFQDISLVSGADIKQDGRGFAVFDFDHDGWLDMAVTSPNSPRLRIFQNQLSKNSNVAGNQSVSISLIGGQEISQPQESWSSRDAIGCTLIAEIEGTIQAFLVSCGEGLSSQNSNDVHIGLGSAKKVDSIKIYWPSGRKSELNDILPGSKVEVRERDSEQEFHPN